MAINRLRNHTGKKKQTTPHATEARLAECCLNPFSSQSKVTELIVLHIQILIFRTLRNSADGHISSLNHLYPGGFLRNLWVGMCRWDPGTLNLYQN